MLRIAREVSRRGAPPDALRSDVYRPLSALIVSGTLAPGARISEAHLAERLGVSRTPVREAVRRLVAEGLLIPDGGGSRPRLAVAPIGVSDVKELYNAAGALEGVAARNVASLTPAERKALADELRVCETRFRAASAAKRCDYDKIFELHNAVHGALRDRCAGPTIRALLDALAPRLDRYEWLYGPLIGPPFPATDREHDAIIKAVRAGDARACERAVRANWTAGAERFIRVLGRAGDLGRSTVIARAVRAGVIPTRRGLSRTG
jgi:DNA-binding GntR family transcriptional regulator